MLECNRVDSQLKKSSKDLGNFGAVSSQTFWLANSISKKKLHQACALHIFFIEDFSLQDLHQKPCLTHMCSYVEVLLTKTRFLISLDQFLEAFSETRLFCYSWTQFEDGLIISFKIRGGSFCSIYILIKKLLCMYSLIHALIRTLFYNRFLILYIIYMCVCI